MAFLRHRQRVITALTPHQGNRRFIIPSRRRQSLNLLPGTTAFWDFAGDRNLTDEISGLTLGFTRTTVGYYYDAQRILQEALIDEPRFNHRLSDGLSLGLLVEEPRTNDCLHSTDLTDPVYLEVANATVDSPDQITVATDTGSGVRQLITGVDLVTDYTFALDIRVISGDSTAIRINFDNNIVVPDLTSEFQRIFVTGPFNSSGARSCFIAERGSSPVAASACVLEIRNVQLEIGGFGTSPIKTGPVAVLRDDDRCFTNDVSWFNQPQGTWFSKAAMAANTDGLHHLWTCSDSSNTDYHNSEIQNNNQIRSYYRTGGTNQYREDFAAFYTPDQQMHKMAMAYAAGDGSTYGDGARGSLITAPLGGLPVGIDVLEFQRWDDNLQPNATIAQFGYNETRLPDNVLQAITL